MKKKIQKNFIYNKKNLLNKKLKIINWINKFSILYNLLAFSKKRLKSNLINFPSDLFFILLLPLLGYTLDKKNFLYNNSNSEFFFKKTLPGLTNFNIIVSSNLNWETFNYTEYFRKINWNKLKKINYFDNSIFICFNSNLYNRHFYIGTHSNNKNNLSSNKLLKKINENKINKKNIEKNEKLNKYFISGRFFNQFFRPCIYNKKNYLVFYKYNSNNLIFNNKNFKNNYFKKLKNWQNFLNELDYIPIKLNSIFSSNINFLNSETGFSVDVIKPKAREEKYIKKNFLIEPLFNNLFFYSVSPTKCWDNNYSKIDVNTNKLYFSTNYDIKESIILKKNILKFENFKTIIEKQNKRLNYEMFNKKISYNLWNFRFFQYKIYNKLFLVKDFLNTQINNFNYNKKKSNNISNLLLNKNNYFINNYENKLLENNNLFLKFIKNQTDYLPNWQNLLRKDLKNLGNTKTEKFFNLDKITNQSPLQGRLELTKSRAKEDKITNFYFLNNQINNLNYNKKEKSNLIFFKNTIKSPISLYNRENKNILIKLKNKDFIKNIDNKKKLKNNKLYEFNVNNKKYSFIPSFERELFYYLNTLIKTNKSVDLKKYSDKILFFIFNNYNFINFSDKNLFNDLSKSEINNYSKKINLLRNKIIEANSDLLKRQMSGYLYPDNKKTNLLFINKLNLFNNSFIKIQGQKNLIYKDFKKFYNNLFFLYNEKNLIDYNIEQINYNNKNNLIKNKNNLIKNKCFFGSSIMDFGLNFNYDKNLNIKNKKENDKINYKPNLNLVYNKRRLDAKIPFTWEYPIKDEFLLNNNNYYNSLLFNKKNFDIFSSTSVFNLPFNQRFVGEDQNSYSFKNKIEGNKLSNNKVKSSFIFNNNSLLEINDYNEISLFPISYKSHFEYNKNYDLLNIYYSNFIKNFKNLFNADLYEVVTFQQFSLLIQFVFLLIFLKLINNLKENYGQSFLIAFKTFFNNFEFDALTNLKIEAGKTVKSKKIRFNNLVGGKVFLQEFNQTILLLKNSKYGVQSNINIEKPEFKFNSVFINKKVFLYSKDKKYKNSFFAITEKQKGFIYNLIYNPFDILFFNYFKLKNNTINNKSFIKNLKNTINIKSFLLVGPPGTGKTLLVKALSGEADVPIILESGEKLSKLGVENETMSENAKGALRLKNLFNRAKKLSPCILFLDEIDNVGKNRKDVLTDYRKQNLQNYSTTNSLYFLSNNKININLLNSNQLTVDNIINNNNSNKFELKLKSNLLLNLKNNNFNLKKKINNNNELSTKSLSMLTQLLCELDGLKNRQDLVIIGATNRPKTLDPALTRPGRLNKIIYIDLPGKQKRFELLKFYSKNKINSNTNINWEFFANQTTGLSAAHLSSSINIALLKTIYNLKKEKKSIPFNKFKYKDSNKFFLIRDFETIEYGIQTIKFKNISFKYKSYELGSLINNLILNYNYYNQLKLVNLLNLSSFFLNYNELYFKNSNLLPFYSSPSFNEGKSKGNKILVKKWINKKQTKLTELKKMLRTIFYKKNKKFIRSLYLLNKKINMKSFFIKRKNNYSILKNFYKYLNRLFKVHMFSCSLLLFSTYVLSNPLMFSFNFLYNYLKFKINIKYNFIKNNKLILTLNKNFLLFKYSNILKYKLIFYNFKLTNNINFVINKKFIYKKNNIFSINNIVLKSNSSKFNLSSTPVFDQYYQNIYEKQNKIQKLILNDSVFINRISYYLGGKALILTTLKKHINLNNLNLWLIKNKFEKNNFINQFIKKLITKEEFESYLLFIITGKISEIKFLLNNNLKNVSNIALDELKEIGWLLNIMINTNFFYKPIKSQLLKQMFIQDLKSSFKINNKKIIKNTKNNNIKFQQKLIILKNKFDKYFLFNKKILINLNYQKFIFWDLIPYWWEPNLKINNFNNMYWSFSKSKKLNLLTLLYKDSLKYNYYYNIINNKLKNNYFTPSNNINQLNKTTYLNSFCSLKSQSEENKLFNINLPLMLSVSNQKQELNNFFKSEINWNSSLLTEYYILMSNIVFNLTSKIFNILETNIELLDYFIYYILCNERFYDFELNKIFLKYYNNDDNNL